MKQTQLRKTGQDAGQVTAKAGQKVQAGSRDLHPELDIQAMIGNHGVLSRLGMPVQPKLKVSKPGDVYEREADRVAETVMRMPRPAGASAPLSPARDVGMHPALQGVLRSSGRPLDKGTREFFEPRFGHDFSAMRVHDGSNAAESAKAMNARAYTVGRDVVFGEGQYSPHTYKGRRLMAHELTHVIHQSDAGYMMQREISAELENAPYESVATASKDYGEDAMRVLAWLQVHKQEIINAEQTYRIDRRAIAGAIAWEALESPHKSSFFIYFSRAAKAPAKPHVREEKYSISEGDPLSKQVEEAGYLPRRSYSGRLKYIESSPAHAIEYIAAMMAAFADIAGYYGYDIRSNPGILTNCYHGTDLKKWRTHMATKIPRSSMKVGNPMAIWVNKEITFLEDAVGKPILPESASKPKRPVTITRQGKSGLSSLSKQPPITMGPTTPSYRGMAALAIAVEEVGVKEVPKGSNRGPCPASALRGCVDAYTDSKRQSWCAHFVSWCFEQTGFSPFGHIASVSRLRTWGRSSGWYVERAAVERGEFIPLVGDIFTMRRYQGIGKQRKLVGGHTGFVIRYDEASKMLETVEGNSGDRVQMRTRTLRELDGFIRIGS